MSHTEITVYGTLWCSDCKRTKKFFGEQRVHYEFVDIDGNADGLRIVEEANNGKHVIPVVKFHDGSTLIEPSNAELARKLTGADEVESTEAMRGDWLGRPPAGAPKQIYTPFSPAEGAEQSRFEIAASNATIDADYWDGRLPREAHLVELLRARYPRSRVLDLTPILDELRGVKPCAARGQAYTNITSMPPRGTSSW